MLKVQKPTGQGECWLTRGQAARTRDRTPTDIEA